MENAKEDYWSEMYDTITNYNEQNHSPLSNTKIIEVIYQVVLEDQVESNNVTVDTLSPKINDMTNKVANLTINDIGHNIIEKFENLTLKDVVNNLNGENASDVQVQSTDYPAGFPH